MTVWHSDRVSIWRAIDGARTTPRSSPSAVTIGSFDGVHRGHQFVLDRLRSAAGPADLESVAVTFDPHPLEILRPEHAPARLTSVERRVRLLREHGADEVRVLAFGPEMASWSPEEFVQRVIVDDLAATTVVVGENFRFGRRAAGDVQLLHDLGRVAGFTVEGLGLRSDGARSGHDPRSAQQDPGSARQREAEPFSSTLVRRLVSEGRVQEAAAALGRPHGVEGVVVGGDRRGRSIGYPTANVPVDDRFAVPPDGVYAGWLRCEGASYPAAVSVGTNPTFAGTQRRVESYVMDHGHDLSLYDRPVRVDFVEHLRAMATFDGVDALVAQMALDVSAARRALDSSEHAPG